LISHFGVGFGMDQSVDHVGPMARTVDEVAIALQVVAGHDGLDPRQGREVPDEVNVLETLADGVGGLRVGVLREGFSGAADDVSDLVMTAVAVLSDNGAEIRDVSVPEHLLAYRPNAAINAEGSLALYRSGYYGMFSKTCYPESAVAAVNQFWEEHADALAPHIKLAYLTGEFLRRRYHGRAYARAQNVRGSYARAYDRVLEDIDVLVMPTCLTTAPQYEAPVSPLAAIEASVAVAGVNPAVRNTMPFNYTGHPALALPCGKSGMLPVSLQIVGRAFDEKTLLRVGYAYTQLVPFETFTAVGPDDTQHRLRRDV
jgi:amidase